MSKEFALFIGTVLAGLLLTLASLAVPDRTVYYVTSDCTSTPQTQVNRGYPFGYLQPGLSDNNGQTLFNCSALGAESATDRIAQHTPGHQQIYSLISSHTVNTSLMLQDFAIFALIALYPVSYIVNKRTTVKGRQR